MADAIPPWNELQTAWQSADSVPVGMEEIRAILRRRRRLTALVVLCELGITAGLVALSVQTGRAGAGALDVVFVGGLWLFWLVATVFAWWNRRGAWRRDVSDTGEFVRLSLERAERKIRVAWFSLGLLMAQLVFGVGIFIAFGRTAGGSLAVERLALWLVLIVGSYGSWIAWYYRRARREQEHFRSLLDATEATEQGSSTPP